MPLHLLIVEGNSAELSARIAALGGRPYASGYSSVMTALADDIICTPVYPAEEGVGCLPTGKTFDDFDGAIWTGSGLDAFSDIPVVTRQRDFAKPLFASNTPIFGSCWGLQIITEALGGKVARNPQGREVGVARDIHLNTEGIAHPMFAGKAPSFEAFAVHLDEVVEPVEGSRILASNPMSDIQALVIEEGGGLFWGVQYHPEFDAFDMGIIYERLASALAHESLVASEAQAMEISKDWKNTSQLYDQIELKNWLALVRKLKEDT